MTDSDWSNNVFLDSSSGEGNLFNGTAAINVASITAQNLEPNLPMRTNGEKKIISSLLLISDTINLQAELDSKISNPLESILDATGYKIINLGNATQPQDAVNLQTLESEIKISEDALQIQISANATGVAGNTVLIEDTGVLINANATGISDNTILIEDNSVLINANATGISDNTILIEDNSVLINANMTGIADNVVDLATKMEYQGIWEQKEYQKNDVVTSDGWQMIANKITSDVAPPIPIGDEFYIYGVDNLIQEQETTKQLLFGQRYTASKGGYIRGYRVYTVIGNHYTVYSVKDPVGTPIINQILSFTASTDGWNEYNENILIGAGTMLDIVVLVNEPDPLPTLTPIDYNYVTPNNTVAPLAGQITQSTKEPFLFLVSKTDSNSNPQDPFLTTLTIGDIINGGGQSWAIQSITEELTYYTFQVAPSAVGVPKGIQTFNFETVVPTPITYHNDVDHWISDPSIKGVLSLNGDYDTATINDTQYGVDIKVQEVSVSPDWDVLAYSGNSSGGGGGGQVNDDVNTGILTGGLLGIDGVTTNYTISAGTGKIFDGANYHDVSWGYLVVPYPGGTDNYIALDENAQVVSQGTEYTPTQTRSLIFIGEVFSLDTINVLRVLNYPNYLQWGLNQLRDLSDSIGIFTISGNIFTPGTTAMTIDKTSGYLYKSGANYNLDIRDPNRTFETLAIEPNFTYGTQTNLIPPINGTNLINPTDYDSGGVVTPCPGGANISQIQRVYLSLTGDIIVFYGQQTYSTLEDALNAVVTDPFESNLDFSASILRCLLVIRCGATDLTDTADAVFIEATRFGGAPAGQTSSSSVSNLQETYDNSTPAEITTNPTNGALTITQGSGADTDLVLETRNGSTTTTFSVNGNGDVISHNLIVENSTNLKSFVQFGVAPTHYVTPNVRATVAGQVLSDVNADGVVTWETPSGVTSITAGIGLDGGTITTSGTIDLADTTVSAGSYTSADLTVDAQGRITSASNGAGGGGGLASFTTSFYHGGAWISTLIETFLGNGMGLVNTPTTAYNQLMPSLCGFSSKINYIGLTIGGNYAPAVANKIITVKVYVFNTTQSGPILFAITPNNIPAGWVLYETAVLDFGLDASTAFYRSKSVSYPTNSTVGSLNGGWLSTDSYIATLSIEQNNSGAQSIPDIVVDVDWDFPV